MPKAPEKLRDFDSLLKVVEALRGPDGCPWDKEQTHASLTRYVIEEAFELAEAIDGGDVGEMRDELGDLLLQVVLHSEIARQSGLFNISDVIENLNRKMIRRHPHVFSDVQAKTSDEVMRNWARIKAEEKANASAAASASARGTGQTDRSGESGTAGTKPLSFDIPESLPALLRAQKIGEKTKRVDFDWDTADQCWRKVREEIEELDQALEAGTREHIEAELGDVLFSVAQLARHLSLDSEQALRRCNRRFEERFQRMRKSVAAAGKEWTELPPEEREHHWKAAKS